MDLPGRPSLIQTRRGLGYVLQEPAADAQQPHDAPAAGRAP
jgi:hypothetical protein